MSPKKPKKDFDHQAAHKRFSGTCFNQAWDLMDMAERSPEEDEEMLRLSMTSHWHWTQREDYGPKQASVAYWQTARIFALLGQPDNARRFAERSLEAVGEEEGLAFYRGYAYEALARAAALTGDSQSVDHYLQQAREMAKQVGDAQNRQALEADLATVSG